MKLISLKCPECNAKLDVEEGRKQVYCTYCGTKILLDNENETVHRRIDDAKIKRAEADASVKLKELEIKEYQMHQSNRRRKIRTILSVSLLLVGLSILLSDLFLKLGGQKKNFSTIGYVGIFIVIISMFVWIFSDDNNNDN